jgi:ligand-binding sensor domain-containing protein
VNTFPIGVLFFVLLFCTTEVRSQDPCYVHYSVEDGLPSTEIYYSLQDSKGYMWFATDMGLSKFNGRKFENFSIKDGVVGSTILGLHEDKKGRIWYWNFANQIGYYFKGAFFEIEGNRKLNQRAFRLGSITSVYVDSKDNLWIGIQNRNSWIKIGSKNNFGHFFSTPTLKGKYLCRIEDGFVFGGANKGNGRIEFEIWVNGEKKGAALTNINEINNGKPKINENFRLDRFGDIYYGAHKGWCKIDGRTFAVLECGKVKQDIIGIWISKNGELFLGLNNGGVQCLNSTSISWSKNHFFLEKSVTRLTEDNEGGIWIPTLEDGVYYVYNNSCIKYGDGEDSQLNKAFSVNAISNNELWFGLDNGMILSIHKFRRPKFFSPYTLNQKKNLKTRAIVRAIDSNFMWVGSAQEFLKVNKTTTKGERQKRNERGNRIAAQYIAVADSHQVFTSNNRSVNKLEKEGDFWKGKIMEGDFSRISGISVGLSGELWISDFNGLYCLKDGKILNWNQKRPQLDMRLEDVKVSSTNLLWIATRGKGLLVWDLNKDTVFDIGLNQGLISEFCRKIFLDAGGTAYVACSKGISEVRYNGTFEVKNYGIDQGVPINEVNQVVSLDGRIWVASNSGVVSFIPEKILEEVPAPSVYITRINDKTVSSEKLLEFPHEAKGIRFEFEGISYKSNSAINYRYKLNGRDWVQTKLGFVEYFSIDPGVYEFAVEARLGEGIWGGKTDVICFEIVPFFWETTWFRWIGTGLLFGFVSFGTWLYFGIKGKRENEKNALHSKSVKSELTALRAQMNPHFIFNVMNSIQHYILNHDVESSQYYLSRFGKLMRYVLDKSNLSFIPIQEEVRALKYYLELESLRLNHRFKFEIFVGKSIDADKLLIPSMLIQPFVENAIWHGVQKMEGGIVRISLRQEKKGYIVCEVMDNGVGREKSRRNARKKKRVSYGINATRDRLKLLNEVSGSKTFFKIEDLNGGDKQSVGTKVIMHIVTQVLDEKSSNN